MLPPNNWYLGMIVLQNFRNSTTEFGKICRGKTTVLVIVVTMPLAGA